MICGAWVTGRTITEITDQMGVPRELMDVNPMSTAEQIRSMQQDQHTNDERKLEAH